MTDTNNDRLVRARAYANLLGAIPSSFTEATRKLRQDPAPTCAELAPSAAFLVKRLTRTDTIRTALCFAASTFKPERHPVPGEVKVEDVLVDYRPLDLAATIGLIYIHRRARTICPTEEWSNIDAHLARYLDTAVHVGYALSNAGAVAGVFLGGYIPLAHAMFLKHDIAGFKEYRRHLKGKNLWYDCEYEVSRWGCTSVELAAFFIQTLGLGLPLAESFVKGLSSNDPEGADLDEEAYRFYIVGRWTTNILKTGAIPDMTHRGKFYPLKADLERVLEFYRATGGSGTRYRWLEKRREDLEGATPEKPRNPSVRALEEIDAAIGSDDLIEE